MSYVFHNYSYLIVKRRAHFALHGLCQISDSLAVELLVFISVCSKPGTERCALDVIYEARMPRMILCLKDQSLHFQC